MTALNPIAKRIHNVSPDPVTLTLDDGTDAVFRVSGAEFFQQEFQAEATREDDEAAYRIVSSEDNESVLVGRKPADDAGWSMVGEVVAATATDSARDQ